MAAAAFDRAELMQRLDRDHELLAQLAELFEEGLPDQLGELEQASAGGDGPRLARAAHCLKGALLNLAAGPAAGLAQRLEEAGRTGQLDRAGTLFGQLRGELHRLSRALKGERLSP